MIASPTQPQSAEGLRKVKAILAQAGYKLKADNVYRIELENGSRVLALPGDDDNIRGLTIDGWIIVDEAGRVTPDLVAALARPLPNKALLQLLAIDRGQRSLDRSGQTARAERMRRREDSPDGEGSLLRDKAPR